MYPTPAEIDQLPIALPELSDVEKARTYLFAALEKEAVAKGHRKPAWTFPTLACAELFDSAVNRIGFAEAVKAINKALQRGIASKVYVVAFVDAWRVEEAFTPATLVPVVPVIEPSRNSNSAKVGRINYAAPMRHASGYEEE